MDRQRIERQRVDQIVDGVDLDTVEFTLSELDGTQIRYESMSLRLVQMRTVADLREEALRMDHCVGGYGRSCALGDSLIFSVQRAHDGAPVATLELGSDHSVRQIKGQRNAPLPLDLREKVAGAVNAGAPSRRYMAAPAFRELGIC